MVYGSTQCAQQTVKTAKPLIMIKAWPSEICAFLSDIMMIIVDIIMQLFLFLVFLLLYSFVLIVTCWNYLGFLQFSLVGLLWLTQVWWMLFQGTMVKNKLLLYLCQRWLLISPFWTLRCTVEFNISNLMQKIFQRTDRKCRKMKVIKKNIRHI